jgi:hypothetical protein
MSYNGWTNYATWRVNLEMFDGMRREDICESDELVAIAHACKELAEGAIEETSDGLARDYALAFMSDVNWREIAAHFND